MIKKYIILFLCMVLSSCTSFYNVFERVEKPYVRTLDFVYRNQADTTLVEGMPGDTMLLYAYFGGDSISDMQWDVSYEVFVSVYGEDTAYDKNPLDYDIIAPDNAGFSNATHCEAIKFVIPEDIMEYSPSVDDEALALLGLDREKVLGLIDSIMSTGINPESAFVFAQIAFPELVDEIYKIMQVFTIPIRLHAKINGTFSIESDVMVRYNRFFRAFPNVYENKNPEIKFIGIHKFKEDPYPDIDIEKMGTMDSTYVLYIKDTADTQYYGRNCILSDTILFDPEYTYYINSDSGTISINGSIVKEFRDSCTSITFSNDGDIVSSIAMEEYYLQTFFELSRNEMDMVPDNNDWFLIGGGLGTMDRIYPPLDTSFTQATIWQQIYDGFIGERLRIGASTLKEVNVHFAYTKNYMDEVNKTDDTK